LLSESHAEVIRSPDHSDAKKTDLN
jgi:hypothetical protein